VVTDAGDDLELVGELDHVVVGAELEGLVFGLGFLAGGEDDHGHVARGGVGAEEFDELEAVNLGHDEVLEDDCRLDFAGHLHGLGGVGAEMEFDFGLVGEHAADGFADHGLVVHHEDGDGKVAEAGGWVEYWHGRGHGRMTSYEIGMRNDEAKIKRRDASERRWMRENARRGPGRWRGARGFPWRRR